MNRLDPQAVFSRLHDDLPRSLHRHFIVVGSLAAAFHFRTALEGRAINTKDADIVITPAGEVDACQKMANRLLKLGWTHRRSEHSPPFIRLHPKNSTDYFIEFLGLPKRGQRVAKTIIRVDLRDGWYGVPCFRFMGLTNEGALRSKEGIRYAAPSMMALANLLSHRSVGTQRMASLIEGRSILRSSKDLGRVLALAWLSGREQVQSWFDQWNDAMDKWFPSQRSAVLRGLKDLLGDPGAFEEAWFTTRFGLLQGKNVSEKQLRSVAEQLVSDWSESLS